MAKGKEKKITTSKRVSLNDIKRNSLFNFKPKAQKEIDRLKKNIIK